MISLNGHLDKWSLVVVVITLILFITAVFVHGITHDILLEASVFLVSVKLIIMSYKNMKNTRRINKKLDEIYEKICAAESFKHNER